MNPTIINTFSQPERDTILAALFNTLHLGNDDHLALHVKVLPWMIEDAVQLERVAEVTGADGPALVEKVRKLGADDRLAILDWVRGQRALGILEQYQLS